MNLVYLSVDSDATAGCIDTLHQKETPRRVLIIPETDRLMLIII